MGNSTFWKPLAAALTSACLLLQPSTAFSDSFSSCEPCDHGNCCVQRPEICLSTDQAFYSKYVWRGQNLTDDWVWQPCVGIHLGNLSFNLWGSMDLTDENNKEHKFTEIDYIFDYSNSCCITDCCGNETNVDYSLGFVLYDFPNTTSSPTAEVYLCLNFDVFLNPGFTWYSDVKEACGSYFNFGFSHCWDLNDCGCMQEICGDAIDVCLEAALSLGLATRAWADHYYNDKDVAGARWNDAVLSFSLPICWGECLSIKPEIYFSTILSRRLRSSTRSDENIYGGITMSYNLCL